MSSMHNLVLGMGVPIYMNFFEFEFAPNSHEFVDPPETVFEFEPDICKFSETTWKFTLSTPLVR